MYMLDMALGVMAGLAVFWMGAPLWAAYSVGLLVLQIERLDSLIRERNPR